jgi:hypothetical protein
MAARPRPLLAHLPRHYPITDPLYQHIQDGREVEGWEDPSRIRKGVVLLLPAHQKKRKELFTLGYHVCSRNKVIAEECRSTQWRPNSLLEYS